MDTILVVVHMFLAIGLVGLILIQHGKGADAGAAFGSGASATVFGARGSANFLSRATGILALLFFITSMSLAWLAMSNAREAGLMIGEVPAPVGSEVPAVETAAQGAASEVPEVPAPVAESSDVPEIPVSAETSAPETPLPPADQD